MELKARREAELLARAEEERRKREEQEQLQLEHERQEAAYLKRKKREERQEKKAEQAAQQLIEIRRQEILNSDGAIGDWYRLLNDLEKTSRVVAGLIFLRMQNEVQMKRVKDADGKTWTWIKWCEVHVSRSRQDIAKCISEYKKADTAARQQMGETMSHLRDILQADCA